MYMTVPLREGPPSTLAHLCHNCLIASASSLAGITHRKVLSSLGTLYKKRKNTAACRTSGRAGGVRRRRCGAQRRKRAVVMAVVRRWCWWCAMQRRQRGICCALACRDRRTEQQRRRRRRMRVSAAHTQRTRQRTRQRTAAHTAATVPCAAAGQATRRGAGSVVQRNRQPGVTCFLRSKALSGAKCQLRAVFTFCKRSPAPPSSSWRRLALEDGGLKVRV